MIQAEDDRSHLQLDGFFHIGWFQPEEHQDRETNAMSAKLPGFPELAHRQELNAAGDQFPGHRNHPVSVGIGFDHSEDLRIRPHPCFAPD